MGMGIKSLMGDMGVDKDKIHLQVYTDSSTAKSVANRKGTGKIRHIEVCQLWVQQEVANNRMEVVKVTGENNIADILTTHVDHGTLTKHIENIRMERRNDRHPLNPRVAKDERSTETGMPRRRQGMQTQWNGTRHHPHRQ